MLLLVAPAAARGQRPATVSPALEPLLSRDTVVTVWLFARPERPLEEVVGLVRALDGRPRRVSRWLHAVSADLASAAIRQASRRGILRHIQRVARFVGPPEPVATAANGVAPARAAWPLDSLYGASVMPFHVLNLFPLTQRGFRGQGVRILILDTGFETGLSVFGTTRVVAQRDFVFNDSVVRNQPNDDPAASQHGTSTWSLLGANAPGNMIGIAPDAEYVLAKTEDIRSETRVEEDNYVAALEWADSLGVTVASSSLGYLCFDPCSSGGFSYTYSQLNGDVAVTSVAADSAARRGITLVTAVGNGGPQPRTLITPADAHFAIAAGATDSLGRLAAFSSRGPTADGRIKPELTAPGVSVFVATTAGYARANGTSFSTPIVAGAVALVKQIHPGYGPTEIRGALEGAGSNRESPNSDRGWGTPDVALAATFPRGLQVTDPQDSVLATVTPAFAWVAAEVPAFAQPVRYRFTLAQDSSFAAPLLDTVLASTAVQPPVRFGPGRRYAFRIVATAADSVMLATTGSFRIAGGSAPPITLLFQNFPNPFPSRTSGQRNTCIWFDVSTGGPVRLDVLDLRGHLVRNLVPGAAFTPELPPGRYGRAGPGATGGCDAELTWDGTAEDRTSVPQGIYLLRLQTPDGTLFKRMVFLGSGG